MSDDLIRRLREAAAKKWPDPHVAAHSTFSEAADRIAALEAANEAFGSRQSWWTKTMFDLEAERDRLRGHFEDATADYRRDMERDTALLRQALEALCTCTPQSRAAIAALRERLK